MGTFEEPLDIGEEYSEITILGGENIHPCHTPKATIATS